MGRPPRLLLCALAAFAPYAEAADLSGRSLTAQCQAYADAPASEQGQRCAAFIAGFLAGLTSSDAKGRPETYSQRALRTRLGVRLVGGGSARCVKTSISAEVLTGQLLAHAAARPPAEDETAGALLRHVLARFHACDLLELRRSP